MRAFVAALLVLTAGAARADVVMPPPEHCPPGEVPTTSHEGSRCTRAAPTDCLPGWRGELGGRCALDLCTTDPGCGGGKRCAAQELCFRPVMVQKRHSNELVQELRAMDVCTPSCQSPAECRPSRVCLPAAVATAAPAPGRPPVPTSDRHPGPAGKRGFPPLGYVLGGTALVALAVAAWIIVKRRRK